LSVQSGWGVILPSKAESSLRFLYYRSLMLVCFQYNVSQPKRSTLCIL